jgi:hypothetical protein
LNSRNRFGGALIGLLVTYGAITASAETEPQVASDSRPFYVKMFFERVPSAPPSDFNSRAGQAYMQFLPMVGREDLHAAVEGWSDSAGPCEPATDAVNDVIEEIAARAKDTRILIINEAHDKPHHRAFIQQVALRVQELGYSVFAAETLSENIKDSEHLPFARWFDGTYSNEPVYGQLIRQLKSRGVTLVPYEHIPADPTGSLSRYERASEREEGQANNLVRLLSEMSDDERLFVHVGYSHASEVPIQSFGGQKLAWMASRLKEKTGLDPLTIDQTGCLSNTDAISLTAASRRHEPSQFDLVVGHPRIQFDDGRPSWRLGPGVSKVDIPKEILSADTRVLVEARKVGDSSAAVPIDRVLLWPGESRPLLLPAGRYDIIGFFETDNKQITATIDVGM